MVKKQQKQQRKKKINKWEVRNKINNSKNTDSGKKKRIIFSLILDYQWSILILEVQQLHYEVVSKINTEEWLTAISTVTLSQLAN